MNDNYPSSSEVVRNLNDLRTAYETLLTEGKFRVIRLDAPYFQGYEFWVVNEKGFMWEPAESAELALEYLTSEEAQEYQRA